MNIGLPELLFVLVFIVLPLWAVRRFPLPRNNTARRVLLLGIAALVAVFLLNWSKTFRAVN